MTTATAFEPVRADQPTVMDQLRNQTRASHDLTEAIPFSRAMVERRLPRPRYVGQLAAYAIIHRALDAALSQSNHPAIAAVWRDDLAKTPLLERDLSFFRQDLAGVPAGAIEAGERFAQLIISASQRDPVALLGYLYVLEGSTLGATILRGHVAAAYDLCLETAGGLAYYSPYGNQVMPHWKLFKQRMNEAVIDLDQQQRVVEAAREAFRHVGEVLRALSGDLA